jgi:hypothetical protein
MYCVGRMYKFLKLIFVVRAEIKSLYIMTIQQLLGAAQTAAFLEVTTDDVKLRKDVTVRIQHAVNWLYTGCTLVTRLLYTCYTLVIHLL